MGRGYHFGIPIPSSWFFHVHRLLVKSLLHLAKSSILSFISEKFSRRTENFALPGLFVALQGKVWYDWFDSDIEKEFGLDQLTLWDELEDRVLV